MSNEEANLQHLALEERDILFHVQSTLAKPLTSVKERARGIIYEERMPAIGGWVVPKMYRDLKGEEADFVREKLNIEVSGVDCPPSVYSFIDMGFPPVIQSVLVDLGIETPTQIQMQGIPAILSGRDVIGIAFTGSGKTLAFTLPLVMLAWECEMRKSIEKGEGPFGLVVAPSRELSVQISEVAEKFCDAVRASSTGPHLRIALCIGGTSMTDQVAKLRRGVHIVVGTPGRLNDILGKGAISLRQCKFITMDEADRMVDLGFEDEVRNILDYFQHQRQTLLFSATMPRKIQEFATSALVDPIVINVGRAGAANLGVRQDVEYVKKDMKLDYMLKCLKKTDPPVMVFCGNKSDVDDVLKYLLSSNVKAAAIHSGMDQADRSSSMRRFKDGKADVLVGTDVASKGLDFPDINHVINFDMPREIENYIHRIGRTARQQNRRGIATTFINREVDERVLMDLREVLIEAKQKIPKFFDYIVGYSGSKHDHLGAIIGGIRGCAYCGGLGHRIRDCPKIEQIRRKEQIQDGLAKGSTAGYGGEY